MKIVTRDNFCRDYFKEDVVATNVNKYYGETFVKSYNDKNWNNHSQYYLVLVEDDYEPYDGYADLM